MRENVFHASTIFTSVAGCKCSSDRFVCLKHAHLLCSCELDDRFVLLRYTISELNTLVEALEWKLGAVEAWASEDLGLVSLNVKGIFSANLNPAGTSGISCSKQIDGPSCAPETEEFVYGNEPCSSLPLYVSSEILRSVQHCTTNLCTSQNIPDEDKKEILGISTTIDLILIVCLMNMEVGCSKSLMAVIKISSTLWTRPAVTCVCKKIDQIHKENQISCSLAVVTLVLLFVMFYRTIIILPVQWMLGIVVLLLVISCLGLFFWQIHVQELN